MATYVTIVINDLIDRVGFDFDGPDGAKIRLAGFDSFSANQYCECRMDSANQVSCYSAGADLRAGFWLPARPVKINIKAKNRCSLEVYIGNGASAERVALRNLGSGVAEEIRLE